MTGDRRQPDPHRPGTVYRARPRLWSRRDDGDGPPPSLRRTDPPPSPPAETYENHYGQDPYGQSYGQSGYRQSGYSQSGYSQGGYDQGGYDQGGYDQGGYDQGGYSQGGYEQDPYGQSYGQGGYGQAPYRQGGYGQDPYDPGGPGRGFDTRFGRRAPGPRRPRIRVRWVVLLLVVLLVAYPLALFGVAWRHLGRVTAMPEGARPPATPGRTYLVVGSDARTALTPAERRRLGTGRAIGGRTDTIMLLHVPSGGGPTVLISLPRDSYVSIPGRGKNKINAAYAFGGPQLLVRTVEGATGVHVDEYVETGLLGYADLVDAVGGVNVCVKKAINDKKAHINLKAGCQTFDGKTALGYARARYSDPRGDLGRVERQRQVLAAIAGRTLSPSVVLLPWHAFPAASAGGGALVVGDGTSPWGLARFVMAMRNVAGGGGLSLTVPISNPNLTTPAGSSVAWNTAKAKALFDNIRRDDTEAIRPLADAQKKATGK